MAAGNIRLFLHYDVPFIAGNRRKGRQSLSEPFDLEYNQAVAASMCKAFGDGTHWIEDEEGDKVWPSETTT